MGVAAEQELKLGVRPSLEEVRELSARGVQFEQFNLPFLTQDALGIWTAPNGDRVAWFKDPDGNTLSIAQAPRS